MSHFTIFAAFAFLMVPRLSRTFRPPSIWYLPLYHLLNLALLPVLPFLHFPVLAAHTCFYQNPINRPINRDRGPINPALSINPPTTPKANQSVNQRINPSGNLYPTAYHFSGAGVWLSFTAFVRPSSLPFSISDLPGGLPLLFTVLPYLPGCNFTILAMYRSRCIKTYSFRQNSAPSGAPSVLPCPPYFLAYNFAICAAFAYMRIPHF